MTECLRASSGSETSCVSLRVRVQGVSYWTRGVLAKSCVCVYVCVTVCSSNWSRVAASGTCMSRHQQLGRLGSSGQLLGGLIVWAELLEGYTLYMCIYILTTGPPSWPASERSRMRLLVLSGFVWVLRMSVCDLFGWSCIYTTVYICLAAENTSSAMLLVGPVGMEWQPLSGCWIQHNIFFSDKK